MTTATARRPWFRRQPEPSPAPALTVHDAATLHAHNLTLPQWRALTDQDRAKYRATITSGTNFQNGRL